MRRLILCLQFVVATWSYPLYNPFEYAYPLAYPYSAGYSDLNYGYNFAPQVQSYSPYFPTYTSDYGQDYAATGYAGIPEIQPTLNVLAELPYAVSNEFSVVPMFIVPKNAMNMISQGHITSVSQEQPTMTVKMGRNNSIQCTPAVRLVLDKPMLVGSLRSNVLFPSEVQIIHEGLRMPIRIGAVIAPVLPETYVSQERPVTVRVVYAVPTKPIKITITIEQVGANYEVPQPSGQQPGVVPPVVDQRFPDVSNLPDANKQQQPSETSQNKPQTPPAQENKPSRPSSDEFNASIPPAAETILQGQGVPGSGSPADSPPFGALTNKTDYVNNADAVFVPDQEAVVVESGAELPPKNITVITFPQQEAEPQLEVDEEDEELVNRNPPQFLAPAGIVQSTQPETHVEPFHNDKESPYLEVLREETKKKKL